MKKELIIVQTFDKDGFLTGYKVNGEVVRCKDCKWQSTVHDADDNSNYYMCGVHAQPTDPYAFCSYGERRSE